MKCKKEGCEEWTYGNKEYCWEHYKETVPAYEGDVRKAVIEWLKYEGYTRINTERATAGGGTTIFDVVAACESYGSISLVGVEIKTDHDSYSRLESQLPDYIDIFDYVYLCLDNKDSPYMPFIGIMRFENGKITVERESPWLGAMKTNVLSEAEMSALCKAHGIENHQKIRQAMEIIPSIRKKLIYNRFFAKMDWQNNFISDYIPFSDDELKFVLELGVKLDIKMLKSQTRSLKQTIEGIGKLVRIVEKMGKHKARQLKIGDKSC